MAAILSQPQCVKCEVVSWGVNMICKEGQQNEAGFLAEVINHQSVTVWKFPIWNYSHISEDPTNPIPFRSPRDHWIKIYVFKMFQSLCYFKGENDPWPFS